jgi:hypothetical protein
MSSNGEQDISCADTKTPAKWWHTVQLLTVGPLTQVPVTIWQR